MGATNSKKNSKSDLYRKSTINRDNIPIENVTEEYHIKTIDLNSYSFIKELGKGAFGSVWEAQDENGEKVAIKLMHTIDQHTLNDLINEIKILRDISTSPQCHPGIVCYRGLYKDSSKNQYVLIMDLIEGIELQKYITNQITRPTLVELKKMMMHLFSALAYMHSYDIAHRDIKPANIMYTSKGRLVLVDLGFACYTKNKKPKCTGNYGTPIYEPPELFIGENLTPEDSKAHDVWALALTFYDLMSKVGAYGKEYYILDKMQNKNKNSYWIMPKLILDDSDEGKMLGNIISDCFDEDKETRPKSDDIVRYLQENINPTLPINVVENYDIYYNYSDIKALLILIKWFKTIKYSDGTSKELKIKSITFESINPTKIGTLKNDLFVDYYDRKLNFENSMGRLIIEVNRTLDIKKNEYYNINGVCIGIGKDSKHLVLI